MTVAPARDAAVGRRRRLPGARALRNGVRLYWWAEILFIAVFYYVYSAIRNANEGDVATARRHALELMDFQSAIGINHEHTLQQLALHFKPLIIACNYFYGSLHFVLTAGVLIFLYRKCSDDYPLWRNAMAIATAIALIGFTFWPLMPPRLLPPAFDFVDTLDKYPTFWSFNRGAVNKISNQYAAMPSVHCAWALFCAVVLVPRLRRRWAKWLAALYPVATVIAIVLTGNHFIIDAPAGFLILGIGYAVARVITRAPSEPRRAPLGMPRLRSRRYRAPHDRRGRAARHVR